MCHAMLVCHNPVFMVSRCQSGVPLSPVSPVVTSDVTGSDYVSVVMRNVFVLRWWVVKKSLNGLCTHKEHQLC